jgi:hypothetical protein
MIGPGHPRPSAVFRARATARIVLGLDIIAANNDQQSYPKVAYL